MNVIRIINRLLSNDPIVIHLYHAFTYGDTSSIRGRILRDKEVLGDERGGWWRSFKNLVRRMMTDEVRHRSLILSHEGRIHESVTDEEGYFDVVLNNGSVGEMLTIKTKGARTLNHMLTDIPVTAQYGIVSDIDDTILKTGVASKFKWRLILNTLFVNPWNRKTFEDTSILYKAFEKGTSTIQNPIFYISNSPWNLFGYLSKYLDIHDFPKGVLLLRDVNISWLKRKSIEQQNKYNEIVRIMNACHSLSFILIGDSGEVDIDIYYALYLKYPDRIKSIYIRHIEKSKRLEEVKSILKKLPEGTAMLFKNTSEVIAHARRKGFI